MIPERIVITCFSLAIAAAVAAGQQTTQTTKSASGGREVVVETTNAPDARGRLSPYQETVRETVRKTPGTEQSKHDVFEIGTDGKRRLLTSTESRLETLANGDSSAVHNTWVPDANGRLGLASREVEQTKATAAGRRQIDTTLLTADANGKLTETERTQSTEREVTPQQLTYETTHMAKDANGRWQPLETRTGQVRAVGASGETIQEETIQRPDRNGRMAVSERSVIRRSNEKNQDRVVTETYAQVAEGRFRNEDRLVLSQRVNRTTTTGADGSRSIVEEVEALSPTAPSDPMKVTRRIVTTVRQVGPDQFVTEQQVFERDVNGRMQPVPNSAKKTER